MAEIFQIGNLNYNLRCQEVFLTVHINTQMHGINFLRFFASKIWQIVLNDIKSAKSHDEFNSKKKTMDSLYLSV